MRIRIFAWLLLVSVAAFSDADQGRVEIGPTDTFPIVIDTSGSYVLTTDLHVTAADTNGIEITVDDVDLDLGGHVVRGPGSSSIDGSGIYGWTVSGVSIHNGSVTGFGTGIEIGGSGPYDGVNRFRGLTISHCGVDGINFNGGTAKEIVVRDAGFGGGSGTGFVCTDCAISNVTVRSSFFGMLVLRGTASNCAAIGSEHTGIELRGSTLTGGSAAGNGGNGIAAWFGSIVESTVVKDNVGWGISMEPNQGCNIVNNSGYNNDSGNVRNCGNGNGCFQNHLP